MPAIGKYKLFMTVQNLCKYRKLFFSIQHRFCSTSAVRMAPIPKKFDYLVLGAGSGGIASVRRAAEFGVKGAVIEKGALGGTCVGILIVF